LQERKSPLDGRGVASIARNLTYLLGGQGFYFITRFLYVVVLARFFGPQIYGMINYGIAWYLLFIPLTRMGMETVLIRDVGRNRQEGENTAGLNLTLRMISIALVTAAYIIFSMIYETEPQSRKMILIFAFALIGRSLATWTASMYIAYEVNQYSLRQQAIFRSLEIVLGLLVIFVWKNVLLVVAVHGLVWCLDAVYGLTVIHRKIFPLRLIPDGAGLRSLFLQGALIGLANLLMNFTVQGPLIFFRHGVASKGELGQLALAMQALMILSHIPIALGNVSLPVLSRSAVREDGKESIYLETVIRYALLFGSPVALLGTTLGPWFITEIFGVQYARAGYLIGPVLWLMIPYTIRLIMTGVLQAGRQDVHLFIGGSAGALFFALTISSSIATYEALGSILCATAATLLTAVYFLLAIKKRIKIDWMSSLLKPGLASASSVFVFFLLYSTGPYIACLAAFAILLLICYSIKCLTVEDMALLKSFISWMRAKRPT